MSGKDNKGNQESGSTATQAVLFFLASIGISTLRTFARSRRNGRSKRAAVKQATVITAQRVEDLFQQGFSPEQFDSNPFAVSIRRVSFA